MSGAPPGSGRADEATTARRELGIAVLGAALAGALALVAGGQSWADVTVDRPPPLPPVSAVVTGADAAPRWPCWPSEGPAARSSGC